MSTLALEVSDTACCAYRVSVPANRSLPDIPVDSQRIRLESGDTVWENSEHNGDTSSELYATVEENKHVQLVGEYQKTVDGSVACCVCLNYVYALIMCI